MDREEAGRLFDAAMAKQFKAADLDRAGRQAEASALFREAAALYMQGGYALSAACCVAMADAMGEAVCG